MLRTYKGKDLGFRYSTEEQWTGKYWEDGRKIYTISFINNHTSSSIDLSVTYLRIGDYFDIDYSNTYIIATDGANIHHLVPNKNNLSMTSTYMTEMTFFTKDRISFQVGGGFGVKGYVVTLLYTRTDS